MYNRNHLQLNHWPLLRHNGNDIWLRLLEEAVAVLLAVSGRAALNHQVMNGLIHFGAHVHDMVMQEEFFFHLIVDLVCWCLVEVIVDLDVFYTRVIT